MAAPAKYEPAKELGRSLGNISEALARASGDPVVPMLTNGQILSMIANIMRLESERLGGKE